MPDRRPSLRTRSSYEALNGKRTSKEFSASRNTQTSTARSV
jgi:hypothetical protein